MSQQKVSEKVQEAIFNKLLSIPSNNECADCKNKSPSWVSLDFGVFVCIRCSGVHRQLGPHITRVRSTRLDGWVQENIDIMVATGNQIANAFYENKMTNTKRPSPNSTMEDCRRFIDEKYIKKRWAADGFQEPVKEFLQSVKKGTQPDFGYAQGREAVQNTQANVPEMKVVRKRSLSLENKHKNQQHDLLNNDHDLLGGDGPGSQNDFGDFKQAHPHSHSHIHAHSASPAGKGHHEVKQDTQWNWDLANTNTSNNTNQGGNTSNASQNITNLYNNNQGQQQQQQTQQTKVDLMKLYGQPSMSTTHQNHFMQMGQQNQQAWNQLSQMQGQGGWNNANAGMQGGFQGGFMGNTNQNMQQGGFNQFGGQQGFQQQNMGNMSGFNQQQMGYGMGGNMGNMGMGFNQGQQMRNQFGGNQFQQQQNNAGFGWK